MSAGTKCPGMAHFHGVYLNTARICGFNVIFGNQSALETLTSYLIQDVTKKYQVKFCGQISATNHVTVM